MRPNVPSRAVDPADQLRVVGPWFGVDLIQSAPADEAPEIDRDQAHMLRTAVSEAEPHVRVLVSHVNMPLGQDPVTKGGELHPAQREQATTVFSLSWRR